MMKTIVIIIVTILVMGAITFQLVRKIGNEKYEQGKYDGYEEGKTAGITQAEESTALAIIKSVSEKCDSIKIGYDDTSVEVINVNCLSEMGVI